MDIENVNANLTSETIAHKNERYNPNAEVAMDIGNAINQVSETIELSNIELLQYCPKCLEANIKTKLRSKLDILCSDCSSNYKKSKEFYAISHIHLNKKKSKISKKVKQKMKMKKFKRYSPITNQVLVNTSGYPGEKENDDILLDTSGECKNLLFSDEELFIQNMFHSNDAYVIQCKSKDRNVIGNRDFPKSTKVLGTKVNGNSKAKLQINFNRSRAVLPGNNSFTVTRPTLSEKKNRFGNFF